MGVMLYDAQLWFSHLVETQLVTISPTSLAFLYVAGLLTAFSPCSISLLPLTLAFLGSDSTDNQILESNNLVEESLPTQLSKSISLQTRTLFFTAGLAAALSTLGLIAAFLGNAFTISLGDLPTFAAGLFAIAMGLYLLELVQINFPSLDKYFSRATSAKDIGNPNDNSNADIGKAFLFGASSALVSSPCSSPVLASLLAVIGASGNPTLGVVFLFAFSLGRATPIVAAGSLSGSLTRRVTTTGGLHWINAAFASLLIVWGTYQTLELGTKMVLL
jgi:cytochrome c-type biogenesis protein